MKRYQVGFGIVLVFLVVFLMSGCLFDTDQKYYLPYQEGFSCYVAQGNQGWISHTLLGKNAVDFLMPMNTHVVAARCGKIVDVVLNNPDINCPICSNNYITIEHSGGTITKYVHLNQDNSPKVQVGEYVQRGQFIAYSGNSGNSWLPHLHFEAWGPDANGELSESLVIHFEDVDGDGVPRAYNTYTSRNHLGNGKCFNENGIVSE